MESAAVKLAIGLLLVQQTIKGANILSFYESADSFYNEFFIKKANSVEEKITEIKTYFSTAKAMGSMSNYKKIEDKNSNFVVASLLSNVSNTDNAIKEFITENKKSDDPYCYNLVTVVEKLKGFIGKDCNVSPKRSIQLSTTEYLVLSEKANGLLNTPLMVGWFNKLSIVEKFDLMFKYMDLFIAFHSENKDKDDLSFVHHRIQPSNLFIIDKSTREVGVLLQSKLNKDKSISSNFPGKKFLYAAPENWKIDDVDRSVLSANGFTNTDAIYKGNIVSGVEGDVYSLSVTLMVLMSSDDVIFKGLNDSCLKNDKYDRCLSDLSTNIHKMMTSNGIETLASPFETAIISLPHKRYQTMKIFKQNVLLAFCEKMFNEDVIFGVSGIPKNYVRGFNTVTDPTIHDAQKAILKTICIDNYQTSMGGLLRVLI